MDVEKVFHMTGGNGGTSYAKNSSLQKKASDMVKHITIETINEVYMSMTPKSLGIADLGCSSGPNTLSIIKDMIEAVQRASSEVLNPSPEIRVYLNDLPTNDFNSIFNALPNFCRELRKIKNNHVTSHVCSSSVFIGGYPGSFYERLFPNNCLHFVYSSYSLHWLSRVPPSLCNEQGKSTNKGTIYISESSPPEVSKAYRKQFQDDFSVFLCLRSKELIAGGRMVLIFLGRRSLEHIDRGNSFLWKLLTKSFTILVSQGKIEEEKLDNYDVHFYAPCKEEIEGEVRREGSFGLDLIEMFEIEKNCKDGESYGTAVAMTVRAIQESMISDHFGEAILDILFENYGRILDEEMAKDEIKPVSFVLVLRKLLK